MLDSTLPLTILDYEEFGDPNIPAEFDAIRSYSPYENLSPGICYPPMLVTASFNDTRFSLLHFTLAMLYMHFRSVVFVLCVSAHGTVVKVSSFEF